MKRVVFLVLILMVSLTVSSFSMVGRFGGTVRAASPPSEAWEQTYYQTGFDWKAYSVIQSSDGGYVLGGTNYSYPGVPSGYHALLAKTDSSGNMQWNMSYPGAGNGALDDDEVRCVIQTSDGGYAFAGYTQTPNGNSVLAWLVKTDSTGKEAWSKTYTAPSTNYAYAYSLVQASDGGYALAGTMLWKTDSTGSLQWNTTLGGVAYSTVRTSDGGYALAGSYVWKTNSTGWIQWSGGLPEITSTLWASHAYSIIQTSDGGYAFAGDAGTLAPTVGYVCKTSSLGQVQWNVTGNANVYYSLIQTSDGGYAAAGTTSSFGHGKMDVDLLKTNSAGGQEWETYYGSAQNDAGYSVVEASDGGLAIAGYYYISFMYLIKLSAFLPAAYTATIWAWDVEGWVTEPITMDGSPTGYNSGHTFTLIGTHTFTVPSTDVLGYTFNRWNTGETSITLTVTSGGTYTAEYRPVVLAVRGLDNRIYYRLFKGGSWNSWNVVPTGATCDSPAAALLGDNLFMVVRGMDQSSLYYGSIELDDMFFSGWTQLDGATNSAPTLTSNGTALCLVVRGLNNAIYLRTYTGGVWESWHALSKGATMDGPAAAFVGNNLNLFVRGMDGSSLWCAQVTCDGTFISDWTSNPGATDKKPTLAKVPWTTDSLLCLAVKGLDNRVYVQAGTPWAALPGATIDEPAATGSTGYILRIVVRGADGNSLWYGSYDTYYQSFSGWTQLDGSTASAPTLTS